jgi:hypothetical protein
MNAQETLSLLEALRASGATHFKSQDFEVSFGQSHDERTARGSKTEVDRERGSRGDSDGEIHDASVATAPVENKEATEKLKGLIETMKLDDASLIDKIFPAGAGG